MNVSKTLEDFKTKKLLSEPILQKIEAYENQKPLSLYWEFRSILYLGITLFCTSIGILIYQNIDSIGHLALIVLVACLCIAAFGYSLKNRLPFTPQEQRQDKAFDEYIILLACLLFLSLEGYLQYQYDVFGTKYGIATFLPTVVFFLCAYFFDHRGILSMAITALASWVGVNIAPKSLFTEEQFSQNHYLSHTAIVLGLALFAIGFLSEKVDFKKHFSFNYYFLGGNLSYVASLFALFSFENKIVYALIISILSVFFYIYAQRSHSFVIMLMSISYLYIAISYLVLEKLSFLNAEFTFFYFMLSSFGVIIFLIKQTKELKK